jgi:hypothetical protein
VFDPEKKIESTVVDKIMEKSISNVLKLDLLLLYLRRVHAYCLYCGEEFEDERMLSTRCGPQHIRNCQKIPQADFDEILTKNAGQGDSDEMVKTTELAEQQLGNKAEFEEIKALANLSADTVSGWGGSITFLQKYISQALKRIEFGPRNWQDPREEFINQDKIEYCGSKCKL